MDEPTKTQADGVSTAANTKFWLSEARKRRENRSPGQLNEYFISAIGLFYFYLAGIVASKVPRPIVIIAEDVKRRAQKCTLKCRGPGQGELWRGVGHSGSVAQ